MVLITQYSFHRWRTIFRILGFRGIVYLGLRKFGIAPVIVQIQNREVIFPLYARLSSTDLVTYAKIFLHKEYELDLVSNPSVIVDAGANVGYSAVYFANRYPDSRIIAIEPEFANFQLLEDNCRRYQNITCLNLALWNKEEELQICDSGSGEWGYRTHTKSEGREEKHLVQTITVGKILENFQLGSIDLLKIDIEGAEKTILEDSDDWRDKVGTLICELHERYQPGCERVFKEFSKDFENVGSKGENHYASRKSFATQ